MLHRCKKVKIKLNNFFLFSVIKFSIVKCWTLAIYCSVVGDSADIPAACVNKSEKCNRKILLLSTG
jgi:hypothetical protein